jgi:outer membrane lipoprotein-sorting protein
VPASPHFRAGLLLIALVALPAARSSAQTGEALLPPPAPPDYRGRKVVIEFTSHGPRLTSLSVLCQPGGRERREMHATRGVQVFDGEYSWQYFPERDVVYKRPARAEGGEILSPEQLQRAITSYAIQVVPSGPIAGRRSRALEFAPRLTGSRPRRVVWVDAETALILRTEVYGTNNRLAWLSVFEELEYRPTFDAASFSRPGPPDVTVVDADAEPCLEPAEAERLAGLPLALPAYLPKGFSRQCIRARRQRDYGEIQVVFGDGLSLLSLFESTSFREPAGDKGLASSVAVGHATGRWHDLGLVTGISWHAPWGHLALLGELSRSEMHKVAGSVRTSRELSTSPMRQ